MKDSEFYRMAAEILHEADFPIGACSAIRRACLRGQRSECECKRRDRELERRFCDNTNVAYWLGGDPTEENKPVRVLALLLMSEIAKDSE